MPPTGFHGILGLLIAGKVNSRPGKVGMAWGSVFPDIDLIGSVIALLLTQDEEFTINIHRSFTHSFIIMGLILAIGFILPRLTTKNYPNLLPFIIGLVTGMFLHAILDLFYLGGVALFWPLQPLEERVTLFEYTYNDLSPAYNDFLAKIIATLDGGFESIYYLIFVFLATRYHTDNEFYFSFKGKSFHMNNWLSKLRLFAFGLIGVTIFFLILAFISISWPFIDRSMFIILLYIPLIPVYLLTGFLPLIMRKTVEEISY